MTSPHLRRLRVLEIASENYTSHVRQGVQSCSLATLFDALLDP